MSTFVNFSIITGFFYFISVPLFAANRDTLSVFELKEITVLAERASANTSDNSGFSGGNIFVAEKTVLNTLQHSSLSDYLSQHTAVFIRENGQGMFSTVSLRGTASSHTSVSWNGLPVNSLTMGQTDFSQLPLFFFDRVAIHPGGEGAIYGNGSIGGNISLSSRPEFGKKHSFLLQETAGSFGYTFTGAKIQTGNKNIQSKTAFFFNRANNDFSFSYRDREQRQKNAAYHNYGVLEETDFRLSEKQQLGVKLWHTCFFREIQPSMSNNSDASKYEEIFDRSTRLMVDHTFHAPVMLRTKAAWVNDHQEYKKDVIATHNFIFNLNAAKEWRGDFPKETSIKGGADVRYIRPEVYSYKNGIDEWRTGLYLFSRTLIFRWWEVTCNMRQEFISGMETPFTPSLGSSVRLVENGHNQLFARGNIARSFKAPTLNDRYWGDMDNRYLRPETGINTEAGLNYSFRFRTWSLRADATVYYNKVTDWIMWMPYGNIWKPRNIDEVEIKGIEINNRHTFTFYRTEHILSMNYAYTHAEVKKGFQEMRPFEGRQMPLLPEHTFAAGWQTHLRKFSCSLQGSYTGERTTSNIFDVMEAYTLLNLTAGYRFSFGKHELAISFNMNNLLDEQYQNMPFRAMPGRHFYISAIYSCN